MCNIWQVLLAITYERSSSAGGTIKILWLFSWLWENKCLKNTTKVLGENEVLIFLLKMASVCCSDSQEKFTPLLGASTQ